MADVDEGGQAGLDDLIHHFEDPLATAETRKGFHAFYGLPGKGIRIANGKWAIGSAAGDLRGHAGYVVLWDPEAAARAVSLSQFRNGVSPYPRLAQPATERTEDAPAPIGKIPPSDRLRAAVQHLDGAIFPPPGPDYETWLRVGQAVHSETGGSVEGFTLWDEWSRQFANYPEPGQQSTRAKWRSFHAGGVTGGTVYQLAESTGWEEDLSSEFEAIDDPEPETTEDPSDEEPEADKLRVLPHKRASSVKRILAEWNIEVRFNARAKVIEIRKRSDDPWAWEMLHDYEVLRIREAIAEWFLVPGPGKTEKPLEFSAQALNEHFGALAWKRQCDPFEEWIESLRWDGEERLDTWLEEVWTLTGETDEELVHWASRFIFLGAVYRTYEPGCKLDEMPILVGPGSVGKSSALRWLFPPEKDEWFVDRFDFLETEQRQVEKTKATVIAEASEMAGIRRADIGHLKAAVSSQGATLRLSYRHNPEYIPRRNIIVGTADNDDVLPNDPNLRRFVPIIIESGRAADAMAYLDRWREQLWAEAREAYKTGQPARLPDELVLKQREITSAYRGRDEIIDDLAARAPAVDPLGRGLALRDIMEAVDCPMHQQRVFGQALRDMGWRRGRTRNEGSSHSQRRWFSPEGWVPETPASAISMHDEFEDLDDAAGDFSDVL